MFSLLEQWDMATLSFMESIHSPFLDTFFANFTLLGNGGILWIVLTVVLLFFSKTRRMAVTMAVSLILVLLLGNLVLKPLIARPRPFTADPSIFLAIAAPEDFSFPSGHTYAGIAWSLVLLYCNKKWGIPAFLLALLLGFSRLYLQVHYLTDVLGGIVLGAICAILAIAIAPPKPKKRKKRT